MNNQDKHTFLFLFIAVISLLHWTCAGDTKSKSDSSGKSRLSADLVKANELTQTVFSYVEKQETNQLTKEEAKRLSEPSKVELQMLRSQLSPNELKYNDSIRKVLGNVMVENVMKWRKEQGLIPAEGN